MKLIIYDCYGQEVRLLKSKIMNPGNYSVLWNGCNDLGQQITNGVYVIRLETGNKVLSRKILK